MGTNITEIGRETSTGAVEVANNPATLSTLSLQIKQLHKSFTDELFGGLRKGWPYAVQAGDLLHEAKKMFMKVPRKKRQPNKWEDWIERNCGFSSRTAQVYQQIAKNKTTLERELEKPQNSAVRSIKGALTLLAPPKPQAAKKQDGNAPKALANTAEKPASPTATNDMDGALSGTGDNDGTAEKPHGEGKNDEKQVAESDGVNGGGDPRHDETDVTADLQQSGVKKQSDPLRQNGREGVETVKEVVAHIDEFVAAHLDQCPKLLCALEEALERIATTIAAVPESLRNDADFRRIWPIWLNDRHRRKYSCAPRDLRSSLKALASMAPDAACRALAFAIHNRLKYIKPEHGAALGNTAELGEKRSEPSPPQHPAEQAPETEPITIVLNGRQLEVQKHHGMWRFRPPGDTAWGHAEPESTITIEEHVRALKK